MLAGPFVSCYNIPDRHETARHGKEQQMGLAVDRISAHEVRLLLAFQAKSETWLTNAEAAEEAAIGPRTARLHTSRLIELEVLEVQRVHPASMFRLRKIIAKRPRRTLIGSRRPVRSSGIRHLQVGQLTRPVLTTVCVVGRP